jgi:hypothetical protein
MAAEHRPNAFDVHEVVSCVVNGVAADPPSVDLILAHSHLEIPGVLPNDRQQTPMRHRLPL